jgi:signal transduction histidine kinase
MATGYATVESAVESMRLGAYDYVSKPYELDRLGAVLDRALEHGRLKGEVARLEETDRAKSEFLANLSHELRTPLNSIIGYAELVLEGTYGPAPAAQAQAMGRVKSSAKTLLAMINDVLDLSKLNAGMMPLEHEDFDLAALVEEVRATVAVLARAKDLELTAVAEPRRVRADRLRVRQVLLNLAANAVKYTARGSVSISAVVPAEGRLRLRVSDTGVGISLEQQARVFERFTRAPGAPSSGTGTGLGLSIVKKSVELMSGEVTLESAPGRGSTFTATVAVAPPSDRAAVAAPAPRRVLVVDDDPEVAELLRMTLSSEGHRISRADTAAAAISALRAERPDLAFIDLGLPDRDGSVVLDELESNPDLRGVAAIVLSGRELAGQERERLERRADMILSKGRADIAEMLAAVRARLESAHA